MHHIGEKRALTQQDILLLNNRFQFFPNNAQMVLDAGDDIKLRLKEILKRNTF